MAYHDDDEFRLGRTNGGRTQDGGRRFAILRCAKIKNLGNMGASLQHTFRERDTPNADPARVRDNTVLTGAENSRGVLDAWRARAPEKIRVNAVHGLEYFIGGSPGALNAMSREDQDAYFRSALDWLEERHGRENVLSAVIHRDEATPHMTVMTIPLDDRGRLNARALVGDRGKLSAMQTDFAERVGKPHGLERGVQGSRATHERVKSAYAQLQRDLRHQEIALDVAWEYATRLGKRQSIEEKPLNEIIEKSIKEAIRMDDAELASASKARAAQKIRATPAPTSLHKPSSLNTPQPKAPKVVSVDHEHQEETTMQQWTKAKDEGWDDGHG